MKYKFIGKPDSKFPYLITGEVYELEFDSKNPKPVIINPIMCPYNSWRAFYNNWSLTTPPKEIEKIEVECDCFQFGRRPDVIILADKLNELIDGYNDLARQLQSKDEKSPPRT